MDTRRLTGVILTPPAYGTAHRTAVAKNNVAVYIFSTHVLFRF